MTSARRRNGLLALLLGTAASPLAAQFAMQSSDTTADLRGIVNVGNGTAWASGTHGTVLRTEDAGFLWQGCATPPGAEQLDFRGIQAFDDQTAIVMSSGKGDLSRVYKTTDGCKSWRLVFTNPDAEGFFDAVLMNPPGHAGGLYAAVKDYGVIVGDPVEGVFAIFLTLDRGEHWQAMKGRPRASPEETLFAASNQSAAWVGLPNAFSIVTGGPGGSRLLRFDSCIDDSGDRCQGRYPRGHLIYAWEFEKGWSAQPLTFTKTQSGGAFALATASKPWHSVVVGGDFSRPQSASQVADWFASPKTGTAWQPASQMPHGYRSSVAYDAKTKAWITVGPNGTDVSTDDGKNWRPLLPGKLDDADADKRWNALSLPYVVGPHGRIGRLRDDALPTHK